MFSLSSKSLYGLLAMIHLGRQGGKSVQIKEIADAYHISQNYLEQLLLSLRKGGLLKSQRGANGGYLLERPPETIKVLEILEILEGPVEILRDTEGYESLNFFWEQLSTKIKGILSLSLKQLTQELDEYYQPINYVI
jgi:Rrf2 family cysteine metabolism transcriptional repressor